MWTFELQRYGSSASQLLSTSKVNLCARASVCENTVSKSAELEDSETRGGLRNGDQSLNTFEKGHHKINEVPREVWKML